MRSRKRRVASTGSEIRGGLHLPRPRVAVALAISTVIGIVIVVSAMNLAGLPTGFGPAAGSGKSIADIFGMTGLEPPHATDDRSNRTKRDGDARRRGLSKRQRKLIAAYGENEKQVLAILKGALWTQADGNGVIRFTGSTFTESSRGKKIGDTVGFAISAVKEDVSEGQAGGARTRCDCVLLLDGGRTALLTIRTYDSDSGPQRTLECDAFSTGSGQYVSTARSASMSVDDLTPDAIELLGGRDAIAQALRKYCKRYHPTVGHAAWDSQIVIDFSSKTACAVFRLDDASKTRLQLLYSQMDRSYQVSEVSE